MKAEVTVDAFGPAGGFDASPSADMVRRSGGGQELSGESSSLVALSPNCWRGRACLPHRHAKLVAQPLVLT